MRFSRAYGRRLGAVAIVVAVALVPIALVAHALVEEAEESQREKLDLRLAGAVAPASAELANAVSRADARARRLARSAAVQRALRTRDAAALAAVATPGSRVALSAGGRVVAGMVPAPAIRRTVKVVSRGRVVGRVEVAVPLDERLRRRLSARSALRSGEVLLLMDRDRVVAGPLRGRLLDVAPGSETNVDHGGDEYRAVSSPMVGGRDGARLVALASRSPIDAAASARRDRALFAALITLATLAFTAYVLTPAVGRDRLARRGLALIGDALAATHNPRALLPVILQAAVDATGAVGGILVDAGEEVTRLGDPRGVPLVLQLAVAEDGSETLLLLYPPATGFTRDAREIAEWLARQAAIALDNARLHTIAKQQAVTDPLTHLANRRRFMEALTTELHRAERFGSALALVLVDIDNFKRVNDRFGHQTGDDVLVATARVLSEHLRDVDLPARIGGEEFAILLPETDRDGGVRLAERLRSRLADLRTSSPRGEPVRVTASFGIAAYPEASSEAELLGAADAALYRAKLQGKNRVVGVAGPPASEARRSASQ